jgi:hypothetical protein
MLQDERSGVIDTGVARTARFGMVLDLIPLGHQLFLLTLDGGIRFDAF